MLNQYGFFSLIPAQCKEEALSGQLRPQETEVFLTYHQTFRKISKLWQLFSQINRFWGQIGTQLQPSSLISCRTMSQSDSFAEPDNTALNQNVSFSKTSHLDLETAAGRERTSPLSKPCNHKLPILLKHGYLFPLLILLIFIFELLKAVCWVSEQQTCTW